MSDEPLQAIEELIRELGLSADSIKRHGETVVVTAAKHWGHNQMLHAALKRYRWEFEERVGSVHQFVIAAPATTSVVDGPTREQFTVVVEPHPIRKDFYTMTIPGLPGAIWGDAEPEGHLSRDMATALINSWHKLTPDQVELAFEYKA